MEDYNLQDALEHVQELPDIKIRASRTMLAEMIHDEYINENGVTTICIPFEIKQDIEDKLKMLQNNEIRETDEEIVTLFRAAQRHIFWDMTRDSFRRFLTSKEFKAVMNQRKANGDQFTVQTVHAPGQATANAFFNYISRKSITKWAMDKVYEVADAFAFTGESDRVMQVYFGRRNTLRNCHLRKTLIPTPSLGSHRLGSISEKKPVHDSRGGSMKGAKKENGVKMASTLKGSRYDGTGLQGQKKSGSTSSYGSARSRRREVGVKMVSLRKPRSRKNIKDTPVASSQEKDKQSNKKGSGPKKETGAKMNASLNLAVKRKKSIQYAKLGGRLSSCKFRKTRHGSRMCLAHNLNSFHFGGLADKLGANTLVKQSSTSSDLGSLNEDKSVRVSATDAAKTSGAPKTQGVEKANDKDVAAEGVAEEKAKTTKEAKPKDNAHIGEGEAKKKAPKKAKTKSKGEVEPESSKKKKKKKKKGTGKEKAKSPRKK